MNTYRTCSHERRNFLGGAWNVEAIKPSPQIKVTSNNGDLTNFYTGGLVALPVGQLTFHGAVRDGLAS